MEITLGHTYRWIEIIVAHNNTPQVLLVSFVSLHVYSCSFVIQDNASSLLFASRLR